MYAGTGKIDITPSGPVEMEGMIREHPSTGVHDLIYARALVLSNTGKTEDAFAIVGIDICVIARQEADAVRETASRSTGIPFQNIILSASHTHSGPATVGYFNSPEATYVQGVFVPGLVTAIEQAAGSLRPAAVGAGHGTENTVSYYRRLLADDGHIVMNWEPYPPEHLVGPTGEVDPDLGVIKVTDAEGDSKVMALVFNHAGHPNVLSGENYLISADYPGRATQLLDEQFGGMSMFLNGAQGTMDIDGLKDRDFEGLERIGNALADTVSGMAKGTEVSETARIRGAGITYDIPARRISDEEMAWAEKIVEETGGKVQAMADGVGDDYKALLYKRLREEQNSPRPMEHICFAIGDTAFISVPAELFTEIGMRIKEASPFAHTYIIGLANGCVGYVPDHQAISLGGYEVDTRGVDDSAEDLITEKTLQLLHQVYEMK